MLRFASFTLAVFVAVSTVTINASAAVAGTCNVTSPFQGQKITICLYNNQVQFKPVSATRKVRNWFGYDYKANVRPVMDGGLLGPAFEINYGGNFKSSQISDRALREGGFISFPASASYIR
jgi:hypothetical protein